MITGHQGGPVFGSERQRHGVRHGDAEPGFESGGGFYHSDRKGNQGAGVEHDNGLILHGGFPLFLRR